MKRIMRPVLFGALVAASGCGFGLYDDSGSPQVTSSNDGVADAGQWWPWVCPNGSNPAPPTTPQSYTASGTCSDGGTFALSADGCQLAGNWAVLGLSGISTTVPSGIPAAGGWEVTGTGSSGKRDGGIQQTCTAQAAASGALTVTCEAGDGGTPTCVTTLTPVSGP